MLLSEHKKAKAKEKKSSKALQLQWYIQQIRAVQQKLDQTKKDSPKMHTETWWWIVKA